MQGYDLGILMRINRSQSWIPWLGIVVSATGCGGDDSEPKDTEVPHQNAAPAVEIVSHLDGEELLEGSVVTFEGTVSDPEDSADALLVAWYINDSVHCDPVGVDTAGKTTCEVVIEVGMSEARLEAVDTEALATAATIGITVIETESPEAVILEPESFVHHYQDHPITFRGQVSDGEDGPGDLVAWWESDLGGVLDVEAIPDANGEFTGSGYLVEGVHQLTLHVEDTDGKVGQDSASIEVNGDNQAPECEITEPGPGSAASEGSLVLFEGTVSDADIQASNLQVTWNSDWDGELGASTPDSSGRVSLAYRDLTVHTHEITLVAVDEMGASCSASLLYTVGEPPQVLLTSPVQGSVFNEGESIDFLATVSDQEDQPPQMAISWESSIDGVLSTDAPDAQGAVSFSTASLSTGGHSVSVTVTDSDGLYAVASTSLLVNAVPTQPSVILEPDPATTEDDLVVTATGSTDPDSSGAISYGYAWFDDGVLDVSQVGDVFPAAGTTKGHTYRVVVTPSDGSGSGLPAEAERTIINSAPTLVSVSIAPGTGVGTSSTLTCLVTAADPDGDAPGLTYSWVNDTSGSSYGSSETQGLSSASASPGDTVTCNVTATDDEGSAVTDSASVTVENTEPSVDSIVITPSTGVLIDSTLVCSATASDADGGAPTLAYAWTNDVTAATLGTGTSLSLSTSMASPGDTIRCTATATDADGGSANSTTEVIVENRDPSVDSVAISPSTNVSTASTLVCSATTSDADGGTPTLTYAWTNDTTTTDLGTGSGLTLTALASSPGDTITCTATATDADGGSGNNTASVSVENTDPSVDSIVISPSTGVLTESNLACSTTISDADGGTPTTDYVWTNDTTAAGLGTDSTLSLTTLTSSPGDTITCTVTATDADGGSTSSAASVTVENTVPSVDSIAVSPSTGVFTDSGLDCSATASDADGGAPTLSYAWTNDTTAATLGTGTSLTLTASTSSPSDTITCTATATDADGGSASSTASVTVENTDPSVDSVAISPSTNVLTTSNLVCSVTVSDADGGTPTLAYAWTNDTTAAALDSGSSLSLTASTASPGDTITCTATATDADGGSATSTASVTVENTDPTVDSVAISPSTNVSTSSELVCSATASDDDGGTPTLVYAWTNDTTSSSLGSGSTLTLTASTSSPGDTVTCTVIATDADGGTGSNTASVPVENTNPSVDSVAISPSTSVLTSSGLVCSATTSDADGGTPSLSYAWTNDTTSASLGTGTTLTLTASTSSPSDTITCTATATDVDGGSASSTASVTVENTDPSVDLVAISPSTNVLTSSSLVCSATASDDDGGTPTLAYAWTNDTASTTLGTGATLSLTALNSSPADTITCTATGTDSDGGSHAGTASVTVANTDPSLDSMIIGPSIGVKTNTSLVCIASSSDADGGTPTLSYAWTNDTASTTLGSSSTLDLTATTSSPGDTITCTATAEDTDGGSDSSSTTITVENTDPSVDSVSIAPATGVTTRTTLSCSVSSSDLDGGTPTHTYVWSNDSTGTTLGTAASVTLTITTSSPGDTITCTPTATDSDGGSDSSSASVTVENTDPTVDSVAISPSTNVSTSSSLVCSATASDADGDTPTLSYSWSNTTESSVLGTGNALDLTTSSSSPGDTITCTVTATDPDGATHSGSASVSVDNTDPTVDSLSVSPSSSVATNSTLTCSASSSDADGDTPTITYAWTNATESASLGAGATLTLTNTTSSPGDTITCTVTATDPDGGSETASASVTVENTDPAVSGLSISPSSSVTTQTALTCSATVSDVDGDSPTVSYAWTNDTDGTSLGAASSMYLMNLTCSPGDVITCTLTASDADGGSTTGSGSVTVTNTGPTINSLSITPSTGVTTSTVLVCSASASDIDGTPPTITYAWTNATQSTSLDSTATLTLTPTTSSPDDSIVCTATATDPDGGSISASSSVDVVNTAPAAPTILIDPESPVAEVHDLVCQIDTEATDADGDTVSYAFAWEVDGSTWTGTSFTTSHPNDSIDAEFTAGAEEWTCTVTPNDGREDGTAGSDSVDIRHCGSLDFDGTNDQVTMSSYPQLSSTGQVSMSMWFNPDDPDKDVLLWIEDWYVQICESSEDGIAAQASWGDGSCADILADGWNYLATTWDTSTSEHKVWLNGEEQAIVSTWDAIGGDATMYLGSIGSGNYFDGSISEVRIWDRILTATEFENDRWSKIDVTSSSGLVGYWPLNAGSGTTVADSTQNQYDGSIDGATWSYDCPWTDEDGDGYMAGQDCDDFDASSYPGVGDGSSKYCAAASCQVILTEGNSTGSGAYWIQPSGSQPVKVHCDMSTDGGGWTQILYYASPASLRPCNQSSASGVLDSGGFSSGGSTACLSVDDISVIWGTNHELLAVNDNYQVIADFNASNDSQCKDKFLTMLYTDQGAGGNSDNCGTIRGISGTSASQTLYCYGSDWPSSGGGNIGYFDGFVLVAVGGGASWAYGNDLSGNEGSILHEDAVYYVR